MIVDMDQPQAKPSSTRLLSVLVEQHGPALSLLLHVLPGVLTGAIYFLLRAPIMASGYPSMVALYLSVILALVPACMTLILYFGYKRNGRFSLEGVVLYREPIQLRKYFAYVPLIFAVSLMVILVGDKFLDGVLKMTFFSWMPAPDYGLGGGFTKSTLVTSYVLAALSLPLEVAIEELYFRGFLLPRMHYAGRWTTPLHSLLFALYHVWIPWRLITLTISMTPLIFAVRRTKNIFVGMIPHALLDSFYIIFGVAFILGMR